MPFIYSLFYGEIIKNGHTAVSVNMVGINGRTDAFPIGAVAAEGLPCRLEGFSIGRIEELEGFRSSVIGEAKVNGMTLKGRA